MHGPFDKSPKDEPNIYQNWSMKLFALPLLLAIALVGYVVSHPDVAKWVVDAVQTEFVGTRTDPASATPAQIGQPSNQARSGTAR
ncbi:hypothetical protein [Bradyrhizobium sp.]|uniref:hypothetical protein n=1 Tax=Bradyrhizobium sp. TaxID=376 RepID=UPI001DC9704D|nr:hypothetical protein [Bradyrhizobium sp.]MBI5318663.1 hypothetical protein [Bradyrhizobium sp.]